MPAAPRTYLLENVLHGHDDGVLPRHDPVVLPTTAPGSDAIAALLDDVRGRVHHVVVFEHQPFEPAQLVEHHR